MYLAQTLWITQSIILRFCLCLYSGRRRLFPTEYCRKWWQIILFMFLFIFIAAAGAFFRLNIVENDDKSYYLCFYSSLWRPQAPFSDWMLSKLMKHNIIYVLIHLYSGRRRLFPSEYCRKWWQLILSLFLFCFMAASGAFLPANIFKYWSVWAFFPGLRCGAQIYWDVVIYIYIYMATCHLRA